MAHRPIFNSSPDPNTLAAGTECDSCPCVDQGLSQCQDLFSLGSLERTMSTCFGNWSDCSIYQSMARGEAALEREPCVAVVLTVRQQDHVQLRPTGT
ncbi:MAG: hypothetical protein CMJ40_08405 [Phycisphaerae bacterium]|nr:hypothetical protein [Phycisphaerae bacterium]